MLSAREFEDAVMDLEGVRIVLRCPTGQQFPEYNYDRMAANNATIGEWLEARIFHRVGGVEVAVVDGLGATPVRRMKLSTLRNSYSD